MAAGKQMPEEKDAGTPGIKRPLRGDAEEEQIARSLKSVLFTSQGRPRKHSSTNLKYTRSSSRHWQRNSGKRTCCVLAHVIRYLRG